MVSISERRETHTHRSLSDFLSSASDDGEDETNPPPLLHTSLSHSRIFSQCASAAQTCGSGVEARSVSRRHVSAGAAPLRLSSRADGAVACRQSSHPDGGLLSPDGVHDLQCFMRRDSSLRVCEWKPGKDLSRKNYTLVVRQNSSRNYCKLYDNIAGLFANAQWYTDRIVAAEVYENRESANCSRAAYRGRPSFRCNLPLATNFSRQAGMLDLKVRWTQKDKTIMKVDYRAVGEPSQSKVATCQSLDRCTVQNLNASLTYRVRIGCVPCSQCPWSPAHVVPAELTQRPEILTKEEGKSNQGRRTIFLTWTFLQLYDGFNVTISKASGEAVQERVSTTHRNIRLLLSYSAYRVDIQAFNNASVSPPQTVDVPQHFLLSDGETSGINVEVHNMSSFTVHWGAQRLSIIKCFSVEWTDTQTKKTMFQSFYEGNKNYRTCKKLPEPLEPYTRYRLSLHTRHQKHPCNLRSINNTESTYGSTLFYAIEGVPISYPMNLTCFNVTKTSVVLSWSFIPEADLRGFLLGYAIFYSENQRGETHSEKNVTVDPKSSTRQLHGLKSGAVYQVQISGITRPGIGVRSPASRFETIQSDEYKVGAVLSSVLLMVIMATFGLFGSPVVKRVKVLLWPSLPSPGQSVAMQKMQQCPLQYRETSEAAVEEYDNCSLQIVEEEVPVLLPHQEDEKIPEDTEDEDGEEDAGGKASPRPSESAPLPLTGDYTTLEMFLRVPSAGVYMENMQQDLATRDKTKPVHSKDRDESSQMNWDSTGQAVARVGPGGLDLPLHAGAAATALLQVHSD
ncbi:leukemia inhibitory factor receptor isoform 2-T2 [Synchiropus picturatus]